MREQRLFIHCRQSAATQPPAARANGTRVDINWGEAVARTVKIRRHHIEMGTKVCWINLKAEGRQGHDGQLALAAEAQEIFALWLGGRAT